MWCLGINYTAKCQLLISDFPWYDMFMSSLFWAKISGAKIMHIFHKPQNIENMHTGKDWSFAFWGRLSIDFINMYTVNRLGEVCSDFIFYMPCFFTIFLFKLATFFTFFSYCYMYFSSVQWYKKVVCHLKSTNLTIRAPITTYYIHTGIWIWQCNLGYNHM